MYIHLFIHSFIHLFIYLFVYLFITTTSQLSNTPIHSIDTHSIIPSNIYPPLSSVFLQFAYYCIHYAWYIPIMMTHFPIYIYIYIISSSYQIPYAPRMECLSTFAPKITRMLVNIPAPWSHWVWSWAPRGAVHHFDWLCSLDISDARLPRQQGATESWDCAGTMEGENVLFIVLKKMEKCIITTLADFYVSYLFVENSTIVVAVLTPTQTVSWLVTLLNGMGSLVTYSWFLFDLVCQQVRVNWSNQLVF